MGFWMPQRRRGVSQRTPAIQPFRRLLDTAHRLNNALRIFRIGKMRHQRHFADVVQRPQLLPDGMNAIRHKTEAIHPAVNLDVDIQRRVEFGLLKRLNLPVTVHAGGQAVLIEQRQLIGVEETLQHQNRPFPAVLAEQDRLFKVEHREAISAAQRAPDARQAVTIGVGFHHRPQARGGGHTPDNL